MVFTARAGPRHPRIPASCLRVRSWRGRIVPALRARGQEGAGFLQIGLKRGAVRNRKHAVVPLLLALVLLLNLQDSDGQASKNYAGIGLRVMDHQDVERIAVFRLGDG